MQKKPLILALLAGIALSGAAQATLIDRGGGMIYDTDINITWLADANYAQTSGYDADGRMNWDAANAWAAGLSYGGYTDWRLPTTSDIACGSCYGAGSEMGHLFYSELGGTAGAFIGASGDPDLALFTNIQPYVYWSGTEYAPVPTSAWTFYLDRGLQTDHGKFIEVYAWAVRPGDVAAVPEAQTYALMLAGLGLIGWRVRRRGRFGASGASTL